MKKEKKEGEENKKKKEEGEIKQMELVTRTVELFRQG